MTNITPNKKEMLVFQYNDELVEFQELEIAEDIPYYSLLESDFILLFVVPHAFRVWKWQGSETSVSERFKSSKIASIIRDQYAGLGSRVITVDEGEERKQFKILVGLLEEDEKEEGQLGPIFTETEEQLEELDKLSREKILLRIEHAGIPEGYERVMVLVNDTLYAYREYEKNYLGSVVQEKHLFPLKEEVNDGTYFAKEYVPRMLFSYNKVILTEFFKKIVTENNFESNNNE